MKESLVKTHIKELLKDHNWRSWPITQTAYSIAGVADRIALRDGVFMAIEAKVHPGKPTPAQIKFLREVSSENSLAFVVSDRTMDVFRQFLDAFDVAREAQMRNRDASEQTKAILVTATNVLVAPFMKKELEKHADEQAKRKPVGSIVRGYSRGSPGNPRRDEED